MSKIYEALQRAEQMRNSSSSNAEGTLASAFLITPESEAESAPPEFSLANVASQPWKPNPDSLPAYTEAGPLLEQFRTLRSRLHEARLQTPLKSVVVSSGSPLDGKTFVSVNLAISLARSSEQNVLLIDGDMRRPAVHRLLGLSLTPGLGDYLNGTATLNSIMSRGPQFPSSEETGLPGLANLAFIPSGTPMGNSSELITNHRFEELIANVSSTFDWIVIDSPPVGVVSDAIDLARAADGVLLVSRQGRSSSRIVQQTCSAFAVSRILGFVFNDVADPPKNHYYSYYGSDRNGESHRRKLAQRVE